MAQSSLTTTPPNPTPPTNFSFTGATPPNVPNYTKATYADRQNWGSGTVVSPPPYFDDGAAGPLHTYATNTAALASGTGATSGGTENTYPGAAAGAVPASSSVAHEAAGTETRVLAPGNRSYTYVVGTLDMSQSISDGPVATTTTLAAGPNSSHASYLTGTVGTGTPTTTAASGASNVSGAGTTLLTVTGTNFTRASEVYVAGIKQTTNYVSATSLTVTNANKRATAGTLAVTVVNGVGGTPSNATNWTFT